jgi:hypothetical protein
MKHAIIGIGKGCAIALTAVPRGFVLGTMSVSELVGGHAQAMQYLGCSWGWRSDPISAVVRGYGLYQVGPRAKADVASALAANDL